MILNYFTVHGFTYIYIHKNGRTLSTKDMENIRSLIAAILEIPPENVLYQDSKECESFRLTFMIPEENARMLQEKDVLYSLELTEIGVDFLLLHEKKIQVYPPGKIQLNSFIFTIVLNTCKHCEIILYLQLKKVSPLSA